MKSRTVVKALSEATCLSSQLLLPTQRPTSAASTHLTQSDSPLKFNAELTTHITQTRHVLSHCIRCILTF